MAERLAAKAVPLFSLCSEQLSKQVCSWPCPALVIWPDTSAPLRSPITTLGCAPSRPCLSVPVT